MAKLESLNDLFVHELKDLYSAEQQLIKALPEMARAATSPDLKQAFQQHLDQTKGQIDRLDRVFKSLEVSPGGMKCKGIEGVIDEGREILQEKASPQVRDAALISAGQRAEHYEIAAYGTVCTYARELGHEKEATLLQQTLDEEKHADQRLNEIAMSHVNQQANTVGSR